MPVRDFLVWIIWGGKIYPKSRQHKTDVEEGGISFSGCLHLLSMASLSTLLLKFSLGGSWSYLSLGFQNKFRTRFSLWNLSNTSTRLRLLRNPVSWTKQLPDSWLHPYETVIVGHLDECLEPLQYILYSWPIQVNLRNNSIFKYILKFDPMLWKMTFVLAIRKVTLTIQTY